MHTYCNNPLDMFVKVSAQFDSNKIDVCLYVSNQMTSSNAATGCAKYMVVSKGMVKYTDRLSWHCAL